MFTVDMFIWLFLLGIPLYTYFTHQQEKVHVENGKKSIFASYWQTMAMLWCPALIIIFSDTTTITFMPQWQLNQLWGLALLVIVVIGFSYGIMQVVSSQQQRVQVLEAMEPVAWLLPKTKPQLLFFVLGVCISAGIAEEIIFRGYLLPFLQQYMNQYVAILIASIVFGLPHIYQGVSGVFRTALMGLGFCLCVVFFDSLLLAIVLHFLIDAYSGLLYYIAHTKKPA